MDDDVVRCGSAETDVNADRTALRRTRVNLGVGRTILSICHALIPELDEVIHRGVQDPGPASFPAQSWKNPAHHAAAEGSIGAAA